MPRYMILIKASPTAEDPSAASPEIFQEMATFNEQLHAAGVLLSGEGLSPTKDGYRVTYSKDGPAQVTNGPFDVEKEGHVCGWWILKTKNGEEAVSWAKKIPFKEGEVTVRRIAELEDFGDSITDDVREREKKLAKDLERKQEEKSG
ncbi:dgpfaetke family protein [Fusarium austroafricanum]|uniref:Dgpfaetke family protein n=1 Tax=Fusarium austroafricanum TaxID=2364996 RepID=A0A8H4KHL2_9HYPO|nr:dgpfaetke family protein [Fusarium austroafricanum]